MKERWTWILLIYLNLCGLTHFAYVYYYGYIRDARQCDKLEEYEKHAFFRSQFEYMQLTSPKFIRPQKENVIYYELNIDFYKKKTFELKYEEPTQRQ